MPTRGSPDGSRPTESLRRQPIPTHAGNGRAFRILTARGGGLPSIHPPFGHPPQRSTSTAQGESARARMASALGLGDGDLDVFDLAGQPADGRPYPGPSPAGTGAGPGLTADPSTTADPTTRIIHLGGRRAVAPSRRSQSVHLHPPGPRSTRPGRDGPGASPRPGPQAGDRLARRRRGPSRGRSGAGWRSRGGEPADPDEAEMSGYRDGRPGQTISRGSRSRIGANWWLDISVIIGRGQSGSRGGLSGVKCPGSWALPHYLILLANCSRRVRGGHQTREGRSPRHYVLKPRPLAV